MTNYMDIPEVMEEYGFSRAHHHDQVVFHNQEDIIINHDDDQLSQVHDIKKGPWTVEEDSLLFNYVSAHGEGRWNALARHAGLKRTGKSCRLRWLNYLRPSVRRGNITLQEQLLILELHSRWGNRWSKIAQYLPGRTDNEIKNYWRTRVQKQAKQLNCDVTSTQFQHAMRHLWIPRLLERIQSGRVDPSHPPPPHHNPSPSLSPPAADLSASSSDTASELTSDDPTRPGAWAVENGSGHFGSDLHGVDGDAFFSGGDSLETWWSEEDLSFFQQHLLD